MMLNDQGRPFFCASMFPVEQALCETRRSPRWSLFQVWQPRPNNQRAARRGNGTRMVQALLKRLDGQRDEKHKKRF